MLLRAVELYGLREIPGEKNNPQIMQFFKDIGYSWVQGDETAWCSVFINWLALKCGFERSGKLDARSWLKIGVKTAKPIKGKTIIVFWRVNINSWQGHVGIYMGENEDEIYCLGGNQDNMVNIKPYKKYFLLGYRNLKPLRHEYRGFEVDAEPKKLA